MAGWLFGGGSRPDNCRYFLAAVLILSFTVCKKASHDRHGCPPVCFSPVEFLMSRRNTIRGTEGRIKRDIQFVEKSLRDIQVGMHDHQSNDRHRQWKESDTRTQCTIIRTPAAPLPDLKTASVPHATLCVRDSCLSQRGLEVCSGTYAPEPTPQ